MKYFQISACLFAKVKPATDQHQSISPSVIVKATQNRKSPFVPTILERDWKHGCRRSGVLHRMNEQS